MASVSLKEAQNKLPELIQQLAPGEELVITENDQLIASAPNRRLPPCQCCLLPLPGRLREQPFHYFFTFGAPIDVAV
jgi:hypothetical protein